MGILKATKEQIQGVEEQSHQQVGNGCRVGGRAPMIGLSTSIKACKLVMLQWRQTMNTQEEKKYEEQEHDPGMKNSVRFSD